MAPKAKPSFLDPLKARARAKEKKRDAEADGKAVAQPKAKRARKAPVEPVGNTLTSWARLAMAQPKQAFVAEPSAATASPDVLDFGKKEENPEPASAAELSKETAAGLPMAQPKQAFVAESPRRNRNVGKKEENPEPALAGELSKETPAAIAAPAAESVEVEEDGAAQSSSAIVAGDSLQQAEAEDGAAQSSSAFVAGPSAETPPAGGDSVQQAEDGAVQSASAFVAGPSAEPPPAVAAMGLQSRKRRARQATAGVTKEIGRPTKTRKVDASIGFSESPATTPKDGRCGAGLSDLEDDVSSLEGDGDDKTHADLPCALDGMPAVGELNFVSEVCVF